MPALRPSVQNSLARATALLKAGRPAEAIPHLSEAAAASPNAAVLHDLGLACLEAGRTAEAAGAFCQAALLDPRLTDAHFRLGITLERLGDAPGAVAAYDRATALLPSHTEAWFRAGALVYTMGHREEAAGCFSRAASSGPKTGFGRLGAARALLARGRDAEAERALRHLLALDRGNAMAQDLLGNLLAEQGRFAEAKACFERAIARAPLMAGSYYDLVRCFRVAAGDDLPARMRAALQTPGLEPEQRIRLHLALGKAADDLGDYGLAMEQFDSADALRRAAKPFDTAAFDREVDRMIARFSPEPGPPARRAGGPGPAPLLIMGMPRSGTTLVEQIVSSHGAVAAGGELNFWNERGAAWIAAGAPVDGVFLDRASADYRAVLRGIGPDAARVTDKMPFNFLWVGLIHLACPDATILHCRRAPIDVALSIHQTHFNFNLALPTGGAALAAYLRAYGRLAEHWRRVLPQERYAEVEYETLTRSPESEIRRLIGHCGLAWDEACLHPERNAGAVRTASRWQARQPIYRDAVARWRRYEPWLGPLRTLLGETGPP